MFKRSTISLSIIMMGLGSASVLHADTLNYPARMNGAFAYDVTYSCPNRGILPAAMMNDLQVDDPQVAPYAQCWETWDKSTPQSVLAFNKTIGAAAGTAKATTEGVNQLYVYGSDMENYSGSASSDKNIGATATLTAADPSVSNYEKPAAILASDGSIYAGYNNLTNYIDQLSKDTTNKVVNLNVIVDGRHDNLGVFGGFLGQYQNEFGTNDTSINNWSQETAIKAADQILVTGYTDPATSQTFDGICTGMNKAQAYITSKYPGSNITVNGIQFDLESFHLPNNDSDAIVCDGTSNAPKDCGQYYFYQEVEKLFNGTSASGATACKGKYFSNFIMANGLLKSTGDALTPEAKDLFVTNAKDGFPVISLYDLGAGNKSHPAGSKPQHTIATFDNTYGPMKEADMNTARAGFITSDPDYYNTAAQAELNEVKVLDTAGVHYQLGIPMAASAHEFDSFDIQYPGKQTGVYYIKTSTLNSHNHYVPLVADSDAAMFNKDSTITPDDHLQASYIQDLINDITAYKADNPTGYMGLALWSFQPVYGNHWAPRNIIANQSDLYHSEVANEYFMSKTPQSDASLLYSGYLNPNVYMRFYYPNSICSTGNSACPSDELNVWNAVKASLSSTTADLFNFGS